MKMLFHMFPRSLLIIGILSVITQISKVSIAYIIESLINFLEKNGSYNSIWWGLLLTLELFLVLIIHNFLKSTIEHENRLVVTRISSTITLNIARKNIFAPSHKELKSKCVDNLIFLLHTEADTLYTEIISLFNVFLATIANIIIIFIIAADFGSYVYYFLVIYLIIKSTFLVSSYLEGKSREKCKSLIIDRNILMKQIICGISVIKMYVWEKAFKMIIKEKRTFELKYKSIVSAIRIFYLSFRDTISKILILLILLICIYDKLQTSDLHLAVLFKTMILLHIIEWNIFVNGVWGISKVQSCLNSIKGFQDIMNSKDLQREERSSQTDVVKKRRFAIFIEELNTTKFSHGKLTEEDGDCPPTVEEYDFVGSSIFNVNLYVKQRQIAYITGHCNSGKSTLLRAIIGEIPVSAEELIVRGKISYLPQTPWIFNGTVRENIIGPNLFDYERFWKIIKICHLEEECVNYPSGIQTIIGNRGFRIKDTDKSKISLSRALYQNADIFLLDEPFQTLPEHERLSVYRGIKKFLKFKTAVIVTQNHQILSKVDSLIIMNKGRIVHEGEKNEIAEKMLNNIFKDILVEEDQIVQDNTTYLYEEIIDEETSLLNTLSDYTKRGGAVRLFFIILIALVSCVGLNLGIDYLITKYYTYGINKKNLHLIGILLGIMWFLNLILHLLINVFVPKASHELYSQAVANILEAPLKFFKVNSLEGILSKFFKDTIVIDNEIYDIAYQIITYGAYGFGSLIIMFIAMPWTLIPFAVIIIWFFLVIRIPIPSIRDFEKLEINNLCRLFGCLHDVFTGHENLRAYKMSKVLLEKLYSTLNDYTTVKFYCLSAYQWLIIRLQIIFTTCFAIAILICIIKANDLNLILVGLFLVHNSVNLDYLTNFCRACLELRRKMISVRRLLTLTHLDIEEKYTYRPAYSLKTGGQLPHIALQQVMLRYDEFSDPSLINIFLQIRKKHQKISIVGKKDAGKSSLVSAFFRLTEPDGNIIIDGVDISNIPLELARSHYSALTRSPFLFSSSIRKNLDPFDIYEDEALWHVLNRVRMEEIIKTYNKEMETELTSEIERKWSLGEKQRFCLARAILRQKKILILDEATANIDEESNFIIQRVLRSQLIYSTIIVLTRRLHMALDADIVVVLEDGRVMEQGDPANLSRNESSLFYKMLHYEDGDLSDTAESLQSELDVVQETIGYKAPSPKNSDKDGDEDEDKDEDEDEDEDGNRGDDVHTERESSMPPLEQYSTDNIQSDSDVDFLSAEEERQIKSDEDIESKEEYDTEEKDDKKDKD
ncbi:DgyrCDS8582 [Dimorphilus gyrociliatus]|uniref:DgyrCDS8582 n=1 Tax=Dimorphilus gyrociliatus TaxID=2664684 RepID=A0A7I8VUI8_9ANNE|nr:DgyrCDS8582 [Dimorphilus gyrociliatus]